MIASLLQASWHFLPGWMAASALLNGEAPQKPFWSRVLSGTAIALAVGLILNAWGAFWLGRWGLWTDGNALIFPWIPALILHRAARRPVAPPTPVFWAGWVGASLLFVFLYWIPARSEWLVGGWDPGLYTNAALQLLRTGSWGAEIHPFARDLGSEALAPLIRSWGSYAEVFPGVPINPETGAVSGSFSMVSIGFYAVLGRWVGMEGVCQAPLVFAVLTILLMAAIATGRQGTGHPVVAMVILVMGQPLFIHYAATPSSEMIELMGLSGLGAILAIGGRSWKSNIGLGLFVLTISANRLSFLLFGSIGLIGLSLWDWGEKDRVRVLIRHGLIGVALWSGHFLFGWATPVAIQKLAHILPRIEQTGLILTGLALALDGLAAWGGLQSVGLQLGERIKPWILPAMGGLLLGMVGWGYVTDGEAPGNFRTWFVYSGPWVVVAAFVGGLGQTARHTPAIRYGLIFLGISLAVVLWQKHVADLFPWALKRFLPWGTPLMAWGACCFCMDCARRWGREWLMGVLALILVSPAIRVSAQAWKGREYVGLAQRLQEISGHTGRNAFVICDHFQWATPLWMAFGIPAVGGSTLCSSAHSDPENQFWRRTGELQRKGATIYLLSSNADSADRWDGTPGSRKLIWQSEARPFNEIHQHASNRDFPCRQQNHQFKLYEWSP